MKAHVTATQMTHHQGREGCDLRQALEERNGHFSPQSPEDVKEARHFAVDGMF